MGRQSVRAYDRVVVLADGFVLSMLLLFGGFIPGHGRYTMVGSEFSSSRLETNPDMKDIMNTIGPALQALQ